jgi:hypothetical protein
MDSNLRFIGGICVVKVKEGETASSMN